LSRSDKFEQYIMKKKAYKHLILIFLIIGGNTPYIT